MYHFQREIEDTYSINLIIYNFIGLLEYDFINIQT